MEKKESLKGERAVKPVFLPIESLGQRNLVGYSKWDSKESDMTEITEYTAPTSPEENSLALDKVRLFLSSKVYRCPFF